MSARPLVVITTRLPPATCGIGTYSWLLRENWPNESRPVEFLVVDDVAGAGGVTTTDRVSAFNNSAQTLTRELTRIGTADVLLHYAGRAYQRFGCPVWMPGVLSAWKRKFPGSRLMIFLHEMPGDWPMTSRHFWLDQVNAWTIRRLATSADVLVTNTENHATKLRKISGRAGIHLVPVGSNIEIAQASSSPRLRTEFVLFGLPFGRLQTLRLFESHIRQWKATERMTKLHLIGPSDSRFTAEADSLVRSWDLSDLIVRHGVLPSREVAGWLRRVGFALTNVSEETWSKSTTFMACAANHCPIVLSGSRAAAALLSYAIGADEVETITDTELAARSEALADWYEKNAAWNVTAKRIADLFAT